jgi:hypothetical protein
MKFLKLFFLAGFLFTFAAACDSKTETDAGEETVVGKDPDNNKNDDGTKVELDADRDGGSLSVESEDADVSISTEDDGN